MYKPLHKNTNNILVAINHRVERNNSTIFTGKPKIIYYHVFPANSSPVPLVLLWDK